MPYQIMLCKDEINLKCYRPARNISLHFLSAKTELNFEFSWLFYLK